MLTMRLYAFLNMGVVQCLVDFMQGDEDMECIANAAV